MDPHLDIGCGTVKKGRIGIDRYPAPGVNVVMDLNTLGVGAIANEPNQDAVEYDNGPAWAGGDELSTARGLPFPDSSIESAISHHALEHIGDGFIPLMDEVYRVLKPGGVFRIIVPLFPSYSAVSDPDHRRYFMEGTFDAFCGHLGDDNNPTGCWLDSFSVPYTKARFERVHQDMTAPTMDPAKQWTPDDVRELRVALRAVK
jgi:SAM-dependent methyltransferase